MAKVKSSIVILLFETIKTSIMQRVRCTKAQKTQQQYHYLRKRRKFALQSLQIRKMGKRPIQSIPLKYHKITYEQRLQLIDSVLVKGASILQSSKIVGVKFSTAKLIIKRYKQKGTVFETKQQRFSRAQSPPEQIEPPSPTDGQIVEKGSSLKENGKEKLVQEQRFIPFYFSLPPIYYYGNFNTQQSFFGTFMTN